MALDYGLAADLENGENFRRDAIDNRLLSRLTLRFKKGSNADDMSGLANTIPRVNWVGGRVRCKLTGADSLNFEGSSIHNMCSSFR